VVVAFERGVDALRAVGAAELVQLAGRHSAAGPLRAVRLVPLVAAVVVAVAALLRGKARPGVRREARARVRAIAPEVTWLAFPVHWVHNTHD